MTTVRTIALTALLLLGVAPPLFPQPGATVVYLVRHAETAPDGTRNPPLSAAGHERATLLNRTLSDAALTHVHSTDLRRTRSTARPIAERTGLPVRSYDPRDLDGFATWLHGNPGRHLVAGHSNTTPQLVEALGGDPVRPIDEDEYDRLYVVTIAPDGTTTSVLLRYGRAPGP